MMLLSHEGFMETLPRGPLVQHLGRVYAITLHLYGQTDHSNAVAVEAMAYSLQEIARYTNEPSRYGNAVVPPPSREHTVNCARTDAHESHFWTTITQTTHRCSGVAQRYDASLPTPTYEEVSAAGIQQMGARVRTIMREAGEALRRRSLESQARRTPEQAEARAQRRHERVVHANRTAAQEHLRREVRRVRKELGLDDKTGA